MNKSGRRIFGGRGLKTKEVKQPCPAKMNYSSSRSCSIRRPVERKHPTQNGLCIEWANTTKTKLPTRRIAAPNDNGNSGSSIATPSRLHKRGRIASLIDASSLIFFVPTLAFKFLVFPEPVLVCGDPVGRLWRLHAMSCFIR